jgi:putative pyruvate formate lyase activating enzyme
LPEEVIYIWRMIRPDAASILEDARLLRAMPRYVGVVKGALPARYMVARMVPSDHSQDSSTGELMELHASLLREEADLIKRIDMKGMPDPKPMKPKKSLLDLKALIGMRMLEKCQLCERRCSVNRTKGELGYCRLGDGMSVSSAFVHMGEEPEIVPSFTVYGN